MGEGAGLLPSTSSAHTTAQGKQHILILSQSVFLDKSLPLEVRYLAIIQLKNGIDKYWRKTATKYARHWTPELDQADGMAVLWIKKTRRRYESVCSRAQ